MYQNITVGADPELFLKNNNGHFVSSVGKIGGSKEEPRKIYEDGSSVQEDNVAVEYNIAPAKTKEEFINNNIKVLEYLEGYVGNLGLKFSFDAAALFPPEELKSMAAMVFGCEPDFNVWTRSENPRPLLPDDMYNLRSAGGHVHVGWDDPNLNDQEQLVKAMDVFLGCPSILYDKDMLRRKLYGTPGAFRFKPYGIEYRTLSNFWIQNKEHMGWVYDQTQKAIEFLNSGKVVKDKHANVIQDCIMKGDLKALAVIEEAYL
jgi:hypothetical protein